MRKHKVHVHYEHKYLGELNYNSFMVTSNFSAWNVNTSKNIRRFSFEKIVFIVCLCDIELIPLFVTSELTHGRKLILPFVTQILSYLNVKLRNLIQDKGKRNVKLPERELAILSQYVTNTHFAYDVI